MIITVWLIIQLTTLAIVYLFFYYKYKFIVTRLQANINVEELAQMVVSTLSQFYIYFVFDRPAKVTMHQSIRSNWNMKHLLKLNLLTLYNLAIMRLTRGTSALIPKIMELSLNFGFVNSALNIWDWRRPTDIIW